MSRKPMALVNWKMSMTVSRSLAFVRRFEELADGLLDQIDIVICPPYTALWALSREMKGSRLQLGAQNVSPATDPAPSGEISTELLADAGCRWVMLGHWEARRHLGDSDRSVNTKVHLALAAGLLPILLVGEGRDEHASQKEVLARHLSAVLSGCEGEQVASMAFVYEPESAIGAAAPSSVEHAASGTAAVRQWLRDRWGADAADSVRIIYGGGGAPEHAADLLAGPELDGLGATRRGRDPEVFVEIVRQIARAKLS